MIKTKSLLLKTGMLLLLTIVGIAGAIAQAPNLLNYQGVARNAVGNAIPNKQLTLRLSVLNGSATGITVYSETRQVQTNSGGLFTVQIGASGANNVVGTLAGINWLNGAKYLQVEMDPEGGTSFQNMGTTQLVSVPYALSAVTSGTSVNVTGTVAVANGGTGGVTTAEARTNLGLGNVNNTSDAAKPISTLTQAALDTKEALSNKSTDVALGTSDTFYPSQKAVKSYVDTKVGAISAVSSLNGQTGATQTFAMGTAGNDIAFSSSTNTHTLNVPSASSTARGVVTTGTQTFAGAKTFSNDMNVMGTVTGNAAVTSEVTTDLTITAANAEIYKSKILICNPTSGPITITFESGLPAGFNCMVLQKSIDANKINFAGGGGVTMKNRSNFTSTAGSYAIATIVHVGGDIIVTAGDMQ